MKYNYKTMVQSFTHGGFSTPTRGLTQEELAKELGITRATLALWRKKARVDLAGMMGLYGTNVYFNVATPELIEAHNQEQARINNEITQTKEDGTYNEWKWFRGTTPTVGLNTITDAKTIMMVSTHHLKDFHNLAWVKNISK